MSTIFEYSPIALFAYNRPWHTQQTIEALRKNVEARDSDLIVFSDGAKDDISSEKVNEVRQYLRQVEGFKSIRIVEREANVGLASSIISGVSEVIDQYDRVIVLEDDMVTSPYFLRYMNDALNTYRDDDRVVSVHGYCYPIQGLPETFFLKGADCWGWATWRCGWSLFEPDGQVLLAQLKKRKLLHRFDYFGGFDFTGMLKGQIEGRNDSWAIRWYASALLKDKLTLFSGQSLVHNIGNDDSGRHCATTAVFDAGLSMSPVKVGGIEVEEDQESLIQFSRFLKHAKPGVISKIMGKIKRLKGKVGT